MPRQFVFIAIALLTCSRGFAQGTVSVDLLNHEETSGAIPANFRIVDVYVEMTNTDLWMASGIRAATEAGATLNFVDGDANTPGIQPQLFNVGTDSSFYTSLSRPRGRDSSWRFTNAQAAAAGGYDPVTPAPDATPALLNVSYFASPPKTFDPSIDGYIARLSVDVSDVMEIPGFPKSDYANWGAGLTAPPGAVVVLRSEPLTRDFGTVISTFNVPQLHGLNWVVFYIPEPATLALLTTGALAIARRR